MMYRYAGIDRAAMHAAQEAEDLISGGGWKALEHWIAGRVAEEQDLLERGVRDWSEYREIVGRIAAFREVVARPGALIRKAQPNTGEENE